MHDSTREKGHICAVIEFWCEHLSNCTVNDFVQFLCLFVCLSVL